MVRASIPKDGVADFQATMPDRYRSTFDGVAAREHAAIVQRRAGAPTHVEIWRRTPNGGAVLCIVADDRPGLLSFISAALVAGEMDVVSAHVFTRRVPATGRREAVDLLRVQRTSDVARPVLPADLARIRDTVAALVSGEETIEAIVRRVRPPRRAPPGASTRVTFAQNSAQQLAVLTVETFDRPGLLLAIAQALFRARVQIIASEASTSAGRVVDRFTIAELDGEPVRPTRRGVVQMEVLGAIEALARGV